MLWKLCISLVLLQILFAEQSADDSIPVIFIHYGHLPYYLLINVEVVAKSNPVVVLSNNEKMVRYKTKTVSSFHSKNQVIFESMKPHTAEAELFRRQYLHKAPATSPQRIAHELQCLQRWFVLLAYMKNKGLSKVMHSDSDSVMFGNATQAFHNRQNCSAVINVPGHGRPQQWSAGGEASLWSLEALDDFVHFISTIYTHHRAALLNSAPKDATVSDMTMLWHWWVRHHMNDSRYRHAGKSYTIDNLRPDHPLVQAKQRDFNAAFITSMNLTSSVPIFNHHLRLCNGLDVVQRTTFDRMCAWETGSKFFLFSNTSTDTGQFLPYSIGAIVSVAGGQIESVQKNDLQRLQGIPLKFLNIHYTHGGAELIPYDMCRFLHHISVHNDHYNSSRREGIIDEAVRLKCAAVLNRHAPSFLCVMRGRRGYRKCL